jgi:Short repeat of unknown function (DUF308)
VTETTQEPADMIGRLGRNWGWVFAYGLLTLIAGIAVLAWPSETLLVLAVLFGIQLIISGIFRFVGGDHPRYLAADLRRDGDGGRVPPSLGRPHGAQHGLRI